MHKDGKRPPQGSAVHADEESRSESLIRASEPARPQRNTRSRLTAVSAEALPGSVSSSAPAPAYMADYFSRAPAAIIVVDEQFQVYDLNPSAVTRFDTSPDEARSRTCRELLVCRNLNGTLLCGTSNCPLTRVIQQDEALPAEEFFLGPHAEASSEYSVSVVPTPLESGPGAVFVARDLSTLKVANQVRANFVSMVSHELRTPLNSVNGFIDLLVQGHMGPLTEEQRTYLGYTQEGVQQLMTIVEDILFMTRSDSGQFEIKPQKVNSRVLARQVVNSLKLQALKAAVILDKDIPSPTPMLYADPQRMQQVLNNLVTNAIKFTPPNGTVTIRVCPHPQQKDKALFSVIDTGDGIPPEDQPHVFERFYQSNHAMQSKMGGYGLGLSIARLIVEQHGGEIYFESTPGQGTTFYFTAPLYTGQDEGHG